MNFKVRLRNPVFWLGFIPSIVSILYSILGYFNVVPKIAENDVVHLFSLIISMLVTMGVLIDPTTSGLTDSKQGMTYETPKKDEE